MKKPLAFGSRQLCEAVHRRAHRQHTITTTSKSFPQFRFNSILIAIQLECYFVGQRLLNYARLCGMGWTGQSGIFDNIDSISWPTKMETLISMKFQQFLVLLSLFRCECRRPEPERMLVPELHRPQSAKTKYRDA